MLFCLQVPFSFCDLNRPAVVMLWQWGVCVREIHSRVLSGFVAVGWCPQGCLPPLLLLTPMCGMGREGFGRSMLWHGLPINWID